MFDDDRFLLLYKIPAFPHQGVELLKTLLAYHFAFVKIINETPSTHRLPLLLDAIFEGDLEEDNKHKIVKFIYDNTPKNTQIIMSIADTKKSKVSVPDFNENILNNEANLICIGKNQNERAFLSEYDNLHDDYLKETLHILNS